MSTDPKCAARALVGRCLCTFRSTLGTDQIRNTLRLRVEPHRVSKGVRRMRDCGNFSRGWSSKRSRSPLPLPLPLPACKRCATTHKCTVTPSFQPMLQQGRKGQTGVPKASTRAQAQVQIATATAFRVAPHTRHPNPCDPPAAVRQARMRRRSMLRWRHFSRSRLRGGCCSSGFHGECVCTTLCAPFAHCEHWRDNDSIRSAQSISGH